MSVIAENMTSSVSKKFAFDSLKFMTLLFSASVSMLFAAFISAFIVRRAEGNWLEFDLPIQFTISTAIIILSSLVLFLAQRKAKKGLRDSSIIAITTVLAFLFLILQYLGWSELVSNKIFFGGDTSNPAGSFVYVFSGVHGFHIVGGIIFLLRTLYLSFKTNNSEKFYSVLDSASIFWHFLGLLWIILYLFLFFTH